MSIRRISCDSTDICYIGLPRCNPASTKMVSPVINLAEESNQRIVSAISSGVAASLRGTVFSYFSRNDLYSSSENRFECHSVSTSPGQTALIRISGANALARATVMAFNAALEAIYAVDDPIALMPAIEETLTTDPLEVLRYSEQARSIW